MNEQNTKAGKRIVAGVDLSETGDNALREAVDLCCHLPGSELHVANVIYAEQDLHDAQRLARLEQLLRIRMDELRDHVARVCQSGKGGDAVSRETTFHVRIGVAPDALHQLAVDVDADLIVVGTHARRGVGKLLLGSVAESLVQNARVPVLVARPKDFAGLPRTERPDERRPAEDPHGGLTHRARIDFKARTPAHIPGLL